MNAFRVHDLLELRAGARVVAEEPSQQSALDACMSRFVVVRRARSVDGRIAVGVRGVERHERYAGLVPLQDVEARYEPESLRVHGAAGLPAFSALFRLQREWRWLAVPWGPVGSVGAALASGIECVSAASDLDVVIRAEVQEFSMAQIRDAWRSLEAMPCRVDVLIETAEGAFALQEVASAATKVLRRSAQGAELMANPWVVVDERDVTQQTQKVCL